MRRLKPRREIIFVSAAGIFLEHRPISRLIVPRTDFADRVRVASDLRDARPGLHIESSRVRRRLLWRGIRRWACILSARVQPRMPVDVSHPLMA